MTQLQPGTCGVCGCTDDRACVGGCAWADEDRMLCTACSASFGLVFRCPCGVGSIRGTYDDIRNLGVEGLRRVSCRSCLGSGLHFVLETPS